MVEDNPDDADLIPEYMQQGQAQFRYTLKIVDHLAASLTYH